MLSLVFSFGILQFRQTVGGVAEHAFRGEYRVGGTLECVDHNSMPVD